MSDHSSVVGGSSADRVLNCPGSVGVAATLPPAPGSSFANEGTALHEAISAVLEQDYAKDDGVIGISYKGVEITEDLYLDALQPALKFFDELNDELVDPVFTVEERVAFEGIDGAFGTADIIMKAADRSIVLDWKFGRGVPVSATDNAQLKFYAFAGMTTASTQDLFGSDDDWPVELIIVQPRIEDGITRWMTTQKQLKAFARDLREAVGIAGTEQAHFKMGKWCKFCPAKPACPLMLDSVEKAQGVSLDALAGLEDDLADWLGAVNYLKQWIAAVEAMAHERAEGGRPIPGYKLVGGRATRFFVDETMAEKALRRLGLKKADMFVSKFVSPAQAEKALKRIDKELGGDMAKKLIDKKTSGTSLVPEDDPRPAVALPGGALAELGKRLSAI